MSKRIALVVAFLFNFCVFSRADYRYYVWTYQFMTMLPGEAEVELYNRIDQSDVSNPDTARWKRQIEAELGITRRWDISMYVVDIYNATDGKTKFEETKLRTRYKLALKDEFVVDPIVYAEYEIQTDRTFPDKWETRLILARDINRLNLAFNVIPEEFYKTGTKEKDWKVEYSFGVSYPVLREVFRIGVELKGDLKDNEQAAGPVVSFRGKNFWAALGAVFPLNDKTDDIQAQCIVGMKF